ncbi:MAG TPA: hypothetical protein VNA30_02760 [Mycobacteriales bacterium]|nr:hypothetical protein [Mycobacteriales bacterium]
MTTVAGWVWPSNVEPLLRSVSHYVGYSFDDTDWQAIAAALPETDDERPDGWYDYPLAGEPPLRVHLACCVGAAPVMVRVVGPMDAVLEARVDTLVSVLAEVRAGE